MPKKVRIILDVTVRAFTKEEREDEGYEAKDCEGAVSDFDAMIFAECLVEHVVAEQDELFAGSGLMVKLASCDATVE